jgi:fibronectin type III domain protein
VSLALLQVPGRLRTAATCVALVVSTGLAGGLTLVPAAADAAQPAIASPPSAPRHVAASQTGAGKVTVTWDAPTSEGSSAITGYGVGWSTGQSGSGMSAAATARSATFVEMPKGTFTFSVAAANTTGEGPRVSVKATVTKAAPAPTAAVSAGTITAGNPVTFSGTGSPETWVDIERARPGRPFVWLTSTEVDAAGTFAVTRSPKYTATYRVVGASGSRSSTHKVVVKNKLDLTSTQTAARTYRLAGTVFPAHDGQAVALSSQGADGTWATLVTVHTDAKGHWSYKHTYAARTWTFRARSEATTLNAAGSARLTVPVS